jgi:hypothetical protein
MALPMPLAPAVFRGQPPVAVSGACHLGGVDAWVAEDGRALGLEVVEYAPTVRRWSGPGGYRERNLKIASDSDVVHVVVVRELPPRYAGMRFDGCYHCGDRNPLHVKSGGCWTAWRAAKLGKVARWHVVG